MNSRIVELETGLMHLQRELEQMQDMLLEQNRETASLGSRLERLEGRLRKLQQDPLGD